MTEVFEDSDVILRGTSGRGGDRSLFVRVKIL